MEIPTIKYGNVQIAILDGQVAVVVTLPAGNIVETTISRTDGKVIQGQMQ